MRDRGEPVAGPATSAMPESDRRSFQGHMSRWANNGSGSAHLEVALKNAWRRQ